LGEAELLPALTQNLSWAVPPVYAPDRRASLVCEA
jgi:hypothetical protein